MKSCFHENQGWESSFIFHKSYDLSHHQFYHFHEIIEIGRQEVIVQWFLPKHGQRTQNHGLVHNPLGIKLHCDLAKITLQVKMRSSTTNEIHVWFGLSFLGQQSNPFKTSKCMGRSFYTLISANTVGKLNLKHPSHLMWETISQTF